MRSMKEVNDEGVRALIDALGDKDARRFLAQFRGDASNVRPDGEAQEEAYEPLPSMTPEEAHQAVRDMQDPIQQQHML